MWVVLGLDPPQHLAQRRFDIACSCRLGSNLSGPCEHPIRNRWHIAGQHNYLEVRNCRDSLQRRCARKVSFLDVFPRVQCFFLPPAWEKSWLAVMISCGRNMSQYVAICRGCHQVLVQRPDFTPCFQNAGASDQGGKLNRLMEIWDCRNQYHRDQMLNTRYS